MEQGPGGVFKIVFFLNYGYNFETDDPRDLNFFLKTENEKILDTCLGLFQNLDRGPGGLGKQFFSTMPITLELKFFLKMEREKILDTCLGVIQTLDQGPGGALEIVFFNMAITLERRDLKFVL